jgi:hypothetical protein
LTGGTEDNNENLNQDSRFPAEVGTPYLSNTSLDRYLYTIKLSVEGLWRRILKV